MSNTAVLKLETIEGMGLRFSVRSGGGTETVTDSGPGRIAPSPVEMMLVALGGCGGMDVISLLRKKRQQVTAYEVEVIGDRRDEHPRIFTRIEVVHRLRGHDLSSSAVAEAIKLSDTKYCSIHGSLRPEIELVSRFEILPA